MRDVAYYVTMTQSRLPGAGAQGATFPGAGTGMPGASHERTSVEDLLKEFRQETFIRMKAEMALAQ